VKEDPSGRLAEPQDGGADGPFASPQRALQAVREAREAGDTGPLTVLVRGGQYHLTAPLVLLPEHSGTPEGPTVLAAFPGEVVTLSGGVAIEGLQPAEAGEWRTTLPRVREGQLAFRQLWANGSRRVRPRLPTEDTYALAGGGTPEASAFVYAPGHLRADWRNREDIEVVVLQYWTEARLRIAAIDEGTRLVTFTGGSWRPLTWSMGYYVENVAEATTSSPSTAPPSGPATEMRRSTMTPTVTSCSAISSAGTKGAFGWSPSGRITG